MHTSKSVFVRLLLPLLCLGGALMSVSANAALSDVETILVRGFGQTPGNVDGLGTNLDNGFTFTEQLHVDYVSPEYGKSGGGRDLYEYLRGAPDQSSQWPVRCKQACALFSVSTGDLVTRVFLENVRDWAAEDGIAPMNVIATIDVVGAGGGTETANWLLVVGGHTGREIIQNTLAGWGVNLDSIPFVGDVAEDLMPGKARSIATRFEEHRVPRFRISMRPDVLGHIPLPWIPVPAHDLLVPSHSTCGLNAPSPLLGSCSDNVGYSGVTHDLGVKLLHPGPKSIGKALWPYHYPIIMGSGLWYHGNGGSTSSQGHLTYVDRKPEAQGVGFNFDLDGFAKDTVIYGVPYLTPYNCRWSMFVYKCDYKWVHPIVYRRQTLNENGSLVKVLGRTFFRR